MSSEVEVLEVLYVAGTAYSGSTLVAFLFNSHPGIVSIGEMGPVRRTSGYTCSCGRILEECPFFVEVTRRVREAGVDMHPDDLRLRYEFSDSSLLNRLAVGPLGHPTLDAVRDRLAGLLPTYQAMTERCRRRNTAFIRSALAVSGAKVFFSTHKRPESIPLLAGAPDVHLRVVHLIRDPRAKVYSSMGHKPGASVAWTAAAWNRTHRSIERHLKPLPESDWTRLRYEDLCLDPQGEFDRVCRFAGLDPFPLPEDFRQTEHHLIGNVMRKKSDDRTTVRFDERWKREMPSRARARVSWITRPLARRYGYAV